MSESILMDLNLPVRVIEKKDIDCRFNQVIGQGRYGTVYKAKWCCPDVALKSVRMAFKEKYVKRELLVMSQIRHPNIISIMAVALDYSNCHIVMELFKNSVNIRHLLFDKEMIDKFQLNDEKKVSIAIQIYSAMSYLHNDEHLIIHEDVKPENILVNGILDVKLCDMGLSRSNRMPKDLLTTGWRDRGTPMYTAPELTSCTSPASKSSDVWAVGCVMVELYTSRLIWDTSSFEKLLLIYKQKKLPKGVNLIDCKKLKQILKECFHYEPKHRPDVDTLYKYFHETQQKQEYKKKGQMALCDSSSDSE